MISLGSERLMLAGGLDYALRQSSWPGLLVIVVLLFVSSFSWAVMITKYRALERAARASREFLLAWRSEGSPLAVFARGQRFEDSPHYRIYHEGSAALTAQLVGDALVDADLPGRLEAAPKLPAAQLDTVALSLQKACGEATLGMEAQTALLATAVAGGPFLGLLGTVWGVMDTFSKIAESTSAASVKDMAPGVAAALVTTVVGLLVAIPAMFGYNYLVSRVRMMGLSLENFTMELMAAWQHAWLERGGATGPRPLSFRPSVIASLARSDAEEPALIPSKSATDLPARMLPVDPESGLSED
jgi:biopolymer transport protein TolQ